MNGVIFSSDAGGNIMVLLIRTLESTRVQLSGVKNSTFLSEFFLKGASGIRD